MKHREILRLVINLEAAVDCAMSQHRLCREVFFETAGWRRSSEFCDRKLLQVLLDLGGICRTFYLKGIPSSLKKLQPCVEELKVSTQSAWTVLFAEADDGETMRHTQLKFFVESLQVVERRLNDCMYLYQ